MTPDPLEPGRGTPAADFLVRAAAALKGDSATVQQVWDLLCEPVAEPDEATAATRRALRHVMVERLEALPADEEREFLEVAVAAAHGRFESLQRLAAAQVHDRLHTLQDLYVDMVWLRARLDQVTEDPDHDTLSDLTAEIDWCGRAVRHLGAAPPGDRPEQSVTDALADQASSAAVLSLRARMDGLEDLLARSRDERREHLEFDAVWQSFIVAGELETEINVLAATWPHELSEEIAWVGEHRRGIQEAVEEKLEQLAPEQRRAAFRRVAGDLVDRGEETLVTIDEEAPPEALAHLEETESELDWGLTELRALEPSAAHPGGLPWPRRRRTEVQVDYQRLLHARRRVVNEHVEKTISLRMEALLGRRLTALFENLILFLIFGFLVLMWAEARLSPEPGLALEVEEEAMERVARDLADSAFGFGIDLEGDGSEDLGSEALRGYGRLGSIEVALSPGLGSPGEAIVDAALEAVMAAHAAAAAEQAEIVERQRINTWRGRFALADLVICIIFLVEFFLKLALAPRRWNYFRRHFLIDLLPSIPFGWISYSVMQSMMPAGVEAARSVRALRLMKFPRLIRYIRIARPLVRIFRVITFALRGMDRLVRRYANLLNRQVVFFEPLPEVPEERRVREAFIALHGRVTRSYRVLLRELPAKERAPFLARRIDDVTDHLPVRRHEAREAAALTSHATTTAGAARELPAEVLLRGMVTMDATTAEDLLGRDMIMRLDRVVAMLSAPGIRRLPVFREMVRGLDRLDPYELVAQSLRVLGRVGERLMGRVILVADMYGIVTPAQVLDRLGGALVKALGRPAKRLILFGLLFLLVKMFLGMFESAFLQAVNGFFVKALSTAFLVLGGICILPLVFGLWLRRIAGAASDFYERAVEAQFLGLVRGSKQTSLTTDLGLLHDRVLGPEAALHGAGPTAEQREKQLRALQALYESCLSHQVPPLSSVRTGGGGDTSASSMAVLAHHWVEEDRVIQLYRDYLEGAPLHRSDVKVANLFLGNLDMENVHRDRIGMTRREIKRIEKLDLARERSLFGPHMWFNFITDGVAQRTAKLMVNYNQHCLPVEDQAAAPPEERERFRLWLAERELLREGDRSDAQDDETHVDDDEHPAADLERGGRVPYITTVFTALHFVTAEPERDRLVGLIFGEEVMRELQKDRAHIFRSVFGAYPLQTLPRSIRTFNPYRLYLENVAGGRVFLLPLKLLWLAMKTIGWGLRNIVGSVREILSPSFTTRDPRAYYAGYEVAERKIARMRKPIYMAAMQTRARFDLEYLGFRIPGSQRRPDPTLGFRADLDRIGANGEERSWFEDLFHRHRRRYRELQAELERRDLTGDRLVAELHRLGGSGLSARPQECLRAMAIAYIIDYRDAAGLCRAGDETLRIFEQAIHEGSAHLEKRSGLYENATDQSVFQRLKVRLRMGRHREFDLWWQASPLAGRSAAEQDLCRRAYARDTDGVRRLVQLQRDAGGAEAARDRGWNLLLEIARRPGAWSEQIVTVRTVQCLTILDLECYRRLVRQLGEYDPG